MARQRTGQLIKRASGWYARVWTTIDGERVRVMRALGTQSKPAAKAKLARMLAVEDGADLDPKRAETFREAAQRVYDARIAEYYALRPGVPAAKGPRDELAQLKAYAFDVIGDLPAASVKPSNVNDVLDHAKAKGRSKASVQHLRQRVSNVFAALMREGALTSNPVTAASMPRFDAAVERERAVLTDAELAVYLAWEPSEERYKGAARELQTMACVSRMFGGIRTGDLVALRWEAFDTDNGGFTWGYAPRQKTRRPQLLEVPAMLRPIIADHWERAGRPAEGLVFPVRRAGKKRDRTGEQRRGATFAGRFRRDVQRAFEAAAAAEPPIEAPKANTQRWRELFTDTEYTLRVDFHSWRRAFAQALADADVNAQTAQALTGHASLAAHARYLRSSGKLRALPAAALPQITIAALPAGDRAANEANVDQKALAKGIEAVSGDFSPSHIGGRDIKNAGKRSAEKPTRDFTRRTSQVRPLSRPQPSPREPMHPMLG
jgi:integrase